MLIRQILEEIIKKLKTGYQPEKIILYGSYATGKATKDSDIDILVIKDTDASRMDRYLAVTRLLYDPENYVEVSPIIYTPQEIQKRVKMGDDFIKDILVEGIVLYDEKESRVSKGVVRQRQ